jgi:cob(I)alamin adenosyltransferase
MKKAPIYTRTGDKGTTGLVGGTRIKKSDSRIHLYGEIDELNSFIGLAVSYLSAAFDKTFIHEIQSALFDLGSNMACEKENRTQYKLPQLKKELITKIENEIDQINSILPPLHSFVLPGGSVEASAFHVCRTVSRRVERLMVDFEDQHSGETPENALIFINRLSDYFFMLSRSLNRQKNVEEILWVPVKE